ncbi:MAG TPA: hypothetical protein VGB72_03720 [Acidobacteriota bacterium]
MSEKNDVFEVVCPCCRAALWVDAASRTVVQSEKGACKEKSSLDDLLVKEKQRRDGFERKFKATAELEKQKQKKAREKFDKALSHAGSETEEDNDQEK